MALDKMKKGLDRERSSGLGLVPTTHEAIFGHSSLNPPHTRFVWITKMSSVNKDDNLGFLATHGMIRKFGS
jgi:hypothetical protein